jgi:lysophospholipase L1-like esterase
MRKSAFLNAVRNCTLLCFISFLVPPAAPAQSGWVAAWAASPQPTQADPDEPLLNIENQTVRERVRVSIGGTKIRILLSNEFGSAPLVIGSVTVGVPEDPASLKSGSIQAVKFDGRNSVTIPAAVRLLSDPVEFPVSPGAEISISLYFPNRVVTPTVHALALKTAVVSKHGDQTHADKIEGGAISGSSIAVTEVLVTSQASQRLVVAFGDSLTDGDGSTFDADHNWPNDLISRLAKSPANSKLAVVNEGIAGNRLLSDGSGMSYTFGPSGLARFDRDALGVPGVTHIVLLEGINDFCFPGAKLGGQSLADPADTRSAKDLIRAYGELISRAHAHGIKLIGVTLTPFEGVVIPGYYSESKEATRQELNKWIRSSGSFDGVIDFDAVVRDPAHPSRILPKYCSLDHLHPNDAGYQAIADAIDLHLFQ